MSKDYSNAKAAGWGDVLRDIRHGMVFMDAKQARRHEQGCGNVLSMVLPGLQACGSLLWKAALNDETPVDKDEAYGIGTMLESLVEMVTIVRISEINAMQAAHNLDRGLTCFGEPRTAETTKLDAQARREEDGREAA